MWEAIKNDPLLKAVTIIILGILGFGFAFNILFGRNYGSSMDGGEMGGMMGGGYSLENTLSYILLIAFKLFLIALVVVIFIALIKLAEYLLKGEKIIMENLNKDSILKTLGIIILAIVAIGLVLSLFGGMNGNGNFYGMNSNDMNNMMNGNYNGYSMMGNGYNFGLYGLLAFLVKLLLFVSVTGFIVGLAMYIFRNFPKNNGQIIEASTTKNVTTTLCSSCGTELKKEWKCCPSCGEEKVKLASESKTTVTEE
ncbi:MAG: hypothetical protein CVU84_10195 [Firmicutes bacterium HGW-Firmicutes-1]|jgi:predicted RNA-binding Zn-ribbon protein involved in translation (DUF1610 family)|nr:MAG: hypothetical protein CVU84_10195 [Firmicutes bacterium HGW-Firmicutes-1]